MCSDIFFIHCLYTSFFLILAINIIPMSPVSINATSHILATSPSSLSRSFSTPWFYVVDVSDDARRRALDPSENVTSTNRFEISMGAALPHIVTRYTFQKFDVVPVLTIKVSTINLLNPSEFQIDWSKWHFPIGRGLAAPLARLFQLTWVAIHIGIIDSNSIERIIAFMCLS